MGLCKSKLWPCTSDGSAPTFKLSIPNSIKSTCCCACSFKKNPDRALCEMNVGQQRALGKRELSDRLSKQESTFLCQ